MQEKHIFVHVRNVKLFPYSLLKPSRFRKKKSKNKDLFIVDLLFDLANGQRVSVQMEGSVPNMFHKISISQMTNYPHFLYNTCNFERRADTSLYSSNLKVCNYRGWIEFYHPIVGERS